MQVVLSPIKQIDQNHDTTAAMFHQQNRVCQNVGFFLKASCVDQIIVFCSNLSIKYYSENLLACSYELEQPAVSKIDMFSFFN